MREESMLYSETCVVELFFVGGGDGRLEGGKCGRRCFCPELRPVFQWPPREMPSEEQDDRRRSMRNGTWRKPFWGGSDPTLCGLAAAQRLWRRGSLPPKGSSRIV